MPGIEPTTVPNERFTKAIKTFQAGNDLKVDGLIRSGGPTIHMLGRAAMGPEDGRPSGYDAADFKAAMGRDPNRLLSGRPIFAEAVPIAANPDTELRHPVPKSAPKPTETEKPAAKSVVPDLGPRPPVAGAGDKEPPARKPTKREFQENLMKIGRSTAKAMKIDKNLLVGADIKTYTIIMGLFSYRHLDKRSQRAVNIELEKLRKIDTPLYQQLTTMRADILIQPAWRIWSLTDSELRESIRRNRGMSNLLSVFSSVPGEAAAAIGPVLPAAGVKIAIGGIALPIFLELVAYSMREQAKKMKKELDRRNERK